MAIAEIHVTLKPTLLDTQGATVLKALRQLGHASVQNVRIGKHIMIEVDDALLGAALQAELEQMCQQLLANPVIEDYNILLDDDEPTYTMSINAAPVVVTGTPVVSATPVVTSTPTVTATPVVSATPATTTVVSSTQPAQSSAPEISAPQTVATATTVSQSTIAPTEIAAVVPSAVPSVTGDLSTHAHPDAFAVDYETYSAMSAAQKLDLQGFAWQQHGTWILNELNARRASWILCAGGKVWDSGDTLDNYPSDARLIEIGVAHNLAPFVFTRPPA